MKTITDITTKWDEYIAKGLMKHIFENKTEKIEAGLRLTQNGPEQYIVNLKNGKNICEAPQFKKFKNGIELVFNPFGALKPGVSTTNIGRQKDLPTAVSECVFACQNKKNPLSLLNRQPLTKLTLPKSEWLAYPNITPWERRGLLLWVEKTPNKTPLNLPHKSQILTYSAVQDFLKISFACKNFATFFNSEHGGASANHLHFQSSYCNHKMAVEQATRIDKGEYIIIKGYPATALFFPRNVVANTLWKTIEKIQKANYPFNLITLSSGIYLFVRNPENEIVDEFPGRGLGAINFAGLLITSDKNDFTRLTTKIIASAFKKAIINPLKLNFLYGKL